MKKIWNWLFGRKNKKLYYYQEPKKLFCDCGKEGYLCEVFGLVDDSDKPQNVVLCLEHIKEKCEQGYFVSL